MYKVPSIGKNDYSAADNETTANCPLQVPVANSPFILETDYGMPITDKGEGRA